MTATESFARSYWTASLVLRDRIPPSVVVPPTMRPTSALCLLNLARYCKHPRLQAMALGTAEDLGLTVATLPEVGGVA